MQPRPRHPPEEYARPPKFPAVLVLDNLRSAFNVGALFRVADTAPEQKKASTCSSRRSSSQRRRATGTRVRIPAAIVMVLGVVTG